MEMRCGGDMSREPLSYYRHRARKTREHAAVWYITCLHFERWLAHEREPRAACACEENCEHEDRDNCSKHLSSTYISWCAQLNCNCADILHDRSSSSGIGYLAYSNIANLEFQVQQLTGLKTRYHCLKAIYLYICRRKPRILHAPSKST